MIERALASRGLAGLLKKQYLMRRDCQPLMNWPFDGMHDHFPSHETSNPPIWAFLRGLAGIVKASIGTTGLAVKRLFRRSESPWSNVEQSGLMHQKIPKG